MAGHLVGSDVFEKLEHTYRDNPSMTSATEFAPGLVVQGFTAPLSLSAFKLIAFDMDSTLINI